MKNLRRAIAASATALFLMTTPLVAMGFAGGGTKNTPGSGEGTESASPVPEPGALLLFAAGAVVVGAALRRKRE